MINTTISQFPEAPDSGVDTPEEFTAKADAFVAHQADMYVVQVNQWAGEANTTAGEVNQDATDADSSRVAAETAAGAAATSATEADASATAAADSETAAATSASEAATSATNAATSEGNANTSATESAASAVISEDAAFIAAGSANYKGEWDIAVAYVIGESVSQNDARYICKEGNTGQDPSSSPAYWLSLEIGNNIFLRLDGTSSMEADLNVGNHKIRGVSQSTEAGDAVEFNQWNGTNNAINGHVAETDNPHSVSKDQVGLDFVINTGSGADFLAANGTYATVVESGGSGDYGWIKYSNGSMIQTFSGVGAESADVASNYFGSTSGDSYFGNTAITWIIPFVGKYSAVASSYYPTAQVTGMTDEGCTIQIVSGKNPGSDKVLTVLAVGRWK